MVKGSKPAGSKRMLSIVQFFAWSAAIDSLVLESRQQGFRFLIRLRDDWKSGANRFSGDGEAYFGVFDGKRLVAVGGINRETIDRGRLWRLYVRSQERRKGIGRLLVEHILVIHVGAKG